MNTNDMNDIHIEEEMCFINDIGDVREELAMIKSIVTEQEEVWNRFYKDLKMGHEMQNRNSINFLVAKGPKYQIPKYKQIIQKIDEDAERVEQWITGQLDLKKTHDSLRESQDSTVLSTVVIGFTGITIIFTLL
jgi:hypothetical protein